MSVDKNICSSLLNRELSGCGLNPIQIRLKRRMKIDEIIPKDALKGGHIVMGFTSCNRFILSYTITLQQNNNSNFLLDSETFLYKLYFWLFRPYSLCKLISTVLLFDRNGVSDSNLIINIAQWKHFGVNNNSHILIEARSANVEENPRCYMTLTKVPELKHCTKCIYINKLDTLNYNNSTGSGDTPLLSTPCELHSLTVTLNYELVHPYPPFDAESSLLITEDATPTILINTGNMLHLIQLNPVGTRRKLNTNLLVYFNNFPEEIFLEKYFRLFKTPRINNRVNHFVEKKFFKRQNQENNNIKKVVVAKCDIYDITTQQEDVLTPIDKNFNSFRKRRLADKKYEFVEEEEEFPLISVKKSSRNVMYLKKCQLRINRSYVLINEEAVSTTTEIEDDNYNSNEFPVALTLALYTENCQLSMIPNCKQVKHKINVNQTTMDIEVLANEIATVICQEQRVRFLYLIDFDCVVVETLPEGSVVSLVVLQIQGATCNSNIKKVDFSEDPQRPTETRLKYEASAVFWWSPSSQSCRVLFKSNKLKEIIEDKLKNGELWNPTGQFISVFKRNRLHKFHTIPQLNNLLMVADWRSVDELLDWNEVVTLYRDKLNNNQFVIEEDE